jgi:hypothetical protein
VDLGNSIQQPVSQPEDQHPYSKFERSEQLKNFATTRKEYEKMLKISEGKGAVAYLLFNNRSLADGVRRQYVRAYNLFIETGCDFTPQNLFNVFNELDINETYASSSLRNYYKKLIQIGVESYGFSIGDFKNIKFSSRKQTKEQQVTAINKDVILKLVKILNEADKFEDSLLLECLW